MSFRFLTGGAGERDRRAAAPLFIAAATALGLALQRANGAFEPTAIWLVLGSLVACSLAVAAPRVAALERAGAKLVVPVALVGLALQFGHLLKVPPGIYLERAAFASYGDFTATLAAAAVVAGCLAANSPWRLRLALPALVALFMVAAFWLLRASPHPHIDVFLFQRDAVQQLLAGGNPYAMTFPNIYGDGTPFYGPGLTANGRVNFGFPYPPLSLLLSIPGQLAWGDYRLSQLVLMAATAGLIAQTRSSTAGALAAAVFLFTPRSFFVLEQGWTEPYVVFLLALVVALAVHRPRLVPYALGLFVSVKQYLFVAVPLALLLAPRPWPGWRALLVWGAKAAVVGAAVTLPLALWDPAAFWHDVVALQLHQPFRADALSFSAWYARDGAGPLPTASAFVAAVVAVALCLWRAPRTPAGFAASVALSLLAFFAFNKQAFCNYYYLVIGALCCAAGAVGREDSEDLASVGPKRMPSSD